MSRIKQWITPAIQSLEAYPVADASDLVKLDAMENPYDWPVDLKQDWLRQLEKVALNRYPDAAGTAVKKALREIMAIPDGMEVMLGNGSDELIQTVTLAVAAPARTIVTPAPGFAMYRLIAAAAGVEFCAVDLNAADFTLDRDAMLAAIDAQQPALIFLACPNNPTGNQFAKETVLAIIEAAPGLVVIDEAYHAFADETFLPELARYDHLLLLRTLSKSGLAGLRLGYLVGSPAWLAEFEKIRLPYNINSLTQTSVQFILSHHDVLEAQATTICDSREQLFNALSDMDGISVWPSQANFLLFKCERRDANEIFHGLRQAGILIKNLHGSHALLDQCLRVTVGTGEDNARFLEALQPLL